MNMYSVVNRWSMGIHSVFLSFHPSMHHGSWRLRCCLAEHQIWCSPGGGPQFHQRASNRKKMMPWVNLSNWNGTETGQSSELQSVEVTKRPETKRIRDPPRLWGIKMHHDASRLWSPNIFAIQCRTVVFAMQYYSDYRLHSKSFYNDTTWHDTIRNLKRAAFPNLLRVETHI